MAGRHPVLKGELTGLRTGRAAVTILDPMQVAAYGTDMPINQLATMSVPEPRMLSVQVWDRSMVKAVETRDPGGQSWPQSDSRGAGAAHADPRANEERRKELVKVAHKYAEQRR